MHLIASEEYLDCDDLMPAACESINVDASLAELSETNGYGCIALLAYDVEGMTGLEFALDGWPTGRGAPGLDGPFWCPEGATTFGDPLDSGGATAFRSCAEPDSSGLVLLGYFYFGPVDSADAPINFNFIPSTYTEPEDSLLAVTDCSAHYVADEVVGSSGCTIGGTSEETPECSTGEELVVGGVNPPSAPGNQTVVIQCHGSGFVGGTTFFLSRSDGSTILPARCRVVGDDAVICSFGLARADTGSWDVLLNCEGETVGSLRSGFQVSGFVEEDKAAFVPGRLIVHFHHGALDLGDLRDSASRSDIAHIAPAVEALADSVGVHTIEKMFKGSVPDDTLATARNGDIVRVEDVSQFYILRAPETMDVMAAVRGFRDLPEVVYAEPDYWHFAGSVPNDKYVAEIPKQWGLHNTGQSGGGTPDADIDAPAAWDIDEDPFYGSCPGWDIYTGAGRVNAFRALYLCDTPNGFWKVDREHVTGGTATVTGWEFGEYPFVYTQYRVSRTVTFAFGSTPSVWGNNRSHTTGTIPHPLTSDMLDWKYCRVVPNSVTPTEAELETYIYRRCTAGGGCEWVPTDAANVVFGYSVMPPPIWPQASVEPEQGAARDCALSQNYPNPFNPATTLAYSVRELCHTEIAIYNVRGRRVTVLVDEEKAPGTYSVHWDGLDGEGRAVASGVYFCTMEVGGYRQIRKLVLAR